MKTFSDSKNESLPENGQAESIDMKYLKNISHIYTEYGRRSFQLLFLQIKN